MLATIIIDSYGDMVFYNENDECHRIDGPAFEDADGDKEWFINGENYTEKAFNEYVGELC